MFIGELPLELLFEILQTLMVMDPLTLMFVVPHVSKHMRYICTGVRGEFDLDKFEWCTRCLVHDPGKLVLMTKFFGVLETIGKYFPQSKGIKGIGDMEVLKAPFHGLLQIPPLIGNLTSLKTLDLSNNHLTELPELIGSLTSLKTLNLSFNKLTELPESIGSLVSLRYLYLLDNQLTELPESIGNLTFLEKLDLGMNSLTSVPGSIAELPCLDLLCVQYNKLTSLPVSILSWEKPKELSLMRNTEELSRMARKVHKETRKFKLP